MATKASALVDGAKKWAKNYGAFPNGTEGAVLSVPLRVRGAWDRNDADAIADVFTENGSMLFGDEQLTSREAIRSYLTDIFAGSYRGSKVEDDPVDIQAITENVALVISEGGVVRSGESSLPAGRSNRTTWVVVRERGEWRLFSYQSSPISG
jgi:uncharacterized protein (TIGR02246 family)